MNVGRLKGLAYRLFLDFEADGPVKLVAAIENAYTQSIQSPTDETARALADRRKELEVAVKSSHFFHLSAAEAHLLTEIGGFEFWGEGLLWMVEDAFHMGSPAETVARLVQFRKELTRFGKAIRDLNMSMDSLRILAEEPVPDQAEIEILLPSTGSDFSLAAISKQLGKLDRALADILEASSGVRPILELRSVGSGSIQFYVTVDVAAGVALLGIVNSIVTLINTVLQNRKLRIELERVNAPKAATEELKGWETRLIEEQLDRLREDLLGASPSESGRKHELQKALKHSLRYLADQIDRGVDLDVNILTPIKAEGDGGAPGASLDPYHDARVAIHAGKGATRQLPLRDAPVLMLEAADDPLEDPDAGSSGKGKGKGKG